MLKSLYLGDGNDLRCRIAVQVHLRETLLDADQHLLVPVDLQVRMQAALQQHARASNSTVSWILS
jgi:hypothetical protein